MPKLSIVVPCYNEEETIPLFYPAVEKVVKQMPVETEYWFVNDGSSDDTLAELRKLHAQDPERVHYVSFSRNFGKEAGLYAGLQVATGDYVVVMDADLQDPPEYIRIFLLVNMIVWGCGGQIEKVRQSLSPSFLTSFIMLLIKFLILKLSLEPGTTE